MPTCLVIGAGASHDLCPNFGLGSKLIGEILVLTRKRNPFYSGLINELGIPQIIVDNFNENLVRYQESDDSPTIDEFLTEIETYPEFRGQKLLFSTIGKLAIFQCILNWESKFIKRYPKMNLNETWVSKIEPYIKNVNAKVDGNTLFIISFNYDRLLEWILENHFNVKRNVFERIIHVYGKLSDSLEFGKTDYSLTELLMHIGDIETIYQYRSNGNKNSELYRGVMNIRNDIYFMGFGFDFFNLKNLNVIDNGTPLIRRRNVYTNLYIEESYPYVKRRKETTRIRSIIHNPKFSYYKCSEFIDMMLAVK